MHILGPTLAAIASEKAGIIKAEVPVVTSASGEALPVIVDRANSLGAPLYVVSAEPKFHVEKINDLLNMNLDFGNFTDVITAQSNSLAANYQQINALVSYVVLAIAEKQLTGKILQSFSLGAEKVYWPGRFQYIGGRNLLLDGAHNPGGTLALRRALDLEFEKRPRLFVLSFFENKNVLGALQALLRPGDRVYVSEAQTTRAVCKADSLATWARALGAEAEVADSIAGALQLAESVRSGDDLIVATGSFETVKACMLALGWNSVEDGLTVTTKLH